MSLTGAAVRCRAFIGRDEELAALERMRRYLSKSRGSFVLVSGEPGIGKSRLLTQFRLNTPMSRARVWAVAECLPYATQPFGPLRSLLPPLLRASTVNELPVAARRAVIQLAPERFSVEEVAQYGAMVLEKEELFAALLALLAAVCAKRATLVAIEDLHWADSSTLEFLRYLAPRIAGTRLMLVATYRAERLETNPDLAHSIGCIEREPTARRIELLPLASDEIQAVIANALEGHGAVTDNAIANIVQRSDGNPLHAEELLKTALDGRWSGRRSRLPLTIRTIILERLGALGPVDREVLSYAAVLGYRFDPIVLASIVQRDVDETIPGLRTAVRHNILVDDETADGRLRFRHWLTRETIYDEMLAVEARRLHERILRHIESLPDRESHISELAYHAYECGDSEKAITYGERAARRALDMRGVSEAIEIFTRTLALVGDEAHCARVLEGLAQAYRLQGSSAECIRALERALAIREARQEWDDSGRILHQLVAERSNTGDDGMFADLETFLSEHAARLSTPVKDRLCAFAARFASANNDFDRVAAYLARLSPDDRLDPDVRLSCLIARLNESAYEGSAREWKRVVAAFNGVLPLLSPFLQAIANYTIVQTGMRLHVNAEVERALEAANRIAHEWGFGSLGLFGAAVEASYAWLRGDLVRARERVERVLERPGAGPANGLAAQVAPFLALALGDDSLATRSFHETLFAAARMNRDVPALAALSARAAWLCSKASHEAALADLRLAVGSLERATPDCGPILTTAARYLPVEELPRLVELAATAGSDGAGNANACLARAIVAQREGSAASAAREARDAARLFRELSWPLFEAEALELAGDLDGARGLYRGCRAVGHLRRLSERDTNGAQLSLREGEIAALVTEGYTNAEIALRLAIGEKTVEKQLTSIFRKLGVRSRASLAATLAGRRANQGA